MSRNVLKSVGGILALVAAAAGVLFLADYLRYWRSPEYRVEKGLKELERQYREDKYGGDTPEETLRLFIDALKRGDVELASRYFPVGYQEKWRKELIGIKEKKFLGKMTYDLERTELTIRDGSA
ncbi:MAG: hypothetical protein HYT42_02460, partial [Candidatus Sungbacteria bacterium]|nr:hypothetical protein [Candidatus Sungbacteria bacterium]